LYMKPERWRQIDKQCSADLPAEVRGFEC
jgi:hypothetical protein